MPRIQTPDASQMIESAENAIFTDGFESGSMLRAIPAEAGAPLGFVPIDPTLFADAEDSPFAGFPDMAGDALGDAMLFADDMLF